MALEGRNYRHCLEELAGKEYVFQIRATSYIFTSNHCTVPSLHSNKQAPVVEKQLHLPATLLQQETMNQILPVLKRKIIAANARSLRPPSSRSIENQMVVEAAARVAIVGCRRIVSSRTSLLVSSQSRQMSMDARSVSEKLRNSGLLRTQGLIGGKWTDSYDKTTIKVNNPATGETVADVACMGVKETNDAIASSYEAFPSWSRRTAGDRSKVLRRWFDLLVAHKEELGQLITLEQGKPLKEAIGEVAYGASFIEYYAEEAKRVYGDIIPPNASDRRLLVLKQAIWAWKPVTVLCFPASQ